MDRDLLKGYLDRGLSLEEIGQLENRHPSTVGYWLRKHGLAPVGRAKHTRRGGLTRDDIEPLIAVGCSQRQIAAELGVSQATVRYWLGRLQLRTRRPAPVRTTGAHTHEERVCRVHGRTTFARRSDSGFRCTRCSRAAVAERRRRVKRILVEEAGGRCVICGYSKCIRALQFHHRDPDQKRFNLAGRGLSRSMSALRREARKCVLLCGNCHCEVEDGLTPIP